MRRSCLALGLMCLVGQLVVGCSISDNDRCPSGYVYVSATKVCALVTDAALVAAPGDSSSPKVSEAGGASFGASCAASTDCTSATANYCLQLPGSTAGYCTKAQCTTDCPSGYKCCNCAALSLVACLADADVTAVAAMGCSCS
jgi:hypothetical protein